MNVNNGTSDIFCTGNVCVCVVCDDVLVNVLNPQTGDKAMAAQAAIQAPCATLQASTAAGTATPAVTTPAVPPAAATQATQATLHPDWQAP